MPSIFTNYPISLADRIDELIRTRDELLKELQQPLTIKPSSGWSIDEIAYHLYIVEKGISGMLYKAIKSTERCERKSDKELKTEWENIITFTSNRQERFDAPSFTLPTDPPSLSEITNLLKEVHEKLCQLLNTSSVDELASIARPHAMEKVGLISGLGWISLIAGHKLRHVEQIRELKNTQNKETF